MSTFARTEHELTVAEVDRNLSPSVLYQHVIRYENDAINSGMSAEVKPAGPA